MKKFLILFALLATSAGAQSIGDGGNGGNANTLNGLTASDFLRRTASGAGYTNPTPDPWALTFSGDWSVSQTNITKSISFQTEGGATDPLMTLNTTGLSFVFGSTQLYEFNGGIIYWKSINEFREEGSVDDAFEDHSYISEPIRDSTLWKPNEDGTYALYDLDRAQITVDAGAATMSETGIPVGTTGFVDTSGGATGTAVNADGSTGKFITMTTGATNGDAYSRRPSLSWVQNRRDWRTDGTFRVKTGASVATQRLWIGFAASTPVASATPTIDGAMFRYDTTADGTAFWRACTNDGADGTWNCTTTTTAVSTSTAYTMRIWMNGTNCSFYIDGALVATNTTDLPTSSDSLGPNVSITTLSAATKSLGIGRISWQQQ